MESTKGDGEDVEHDSFNKKKHSYEEMHPMFIIGLLALVILTQWQGKLNKYSCILNST